MINFTTNKEVRTIVETFGANCNKIIKQVKNSLDKDHIDSLQLLKNQLEEYFDYKSFDEKTTFYDVLIKELLEVESLSKEEKKEMLVFLEFRFFDYVSSFCSIESLKDSKLHTLVRYLELFDSNNKNFTTNDLKVCLNSIRNDIDSSLVVLSEYKPFNPDEIEDGTPIHYINYDTRENIIGFYCHIPVDIDTNDEPDSFIISKNYFSPKMIEVHINDVFFDDIERQFDLQNVSFYRPLRFI